jgi:glycosyltransferase involved in cell wall biosynthesis
LNKPLSICALIAVRNEAYYLRVLLPKLAEQQIQVVIIDNESSDDSELVYQAFKEDPIVRVHKIPHKGYFSLTEQMECKEKLLQELDYDWIIHHDADEIMEHYNGKSTLREAIEEADAEGFNVINFDEFVFIPEPETNYDGSDYYHAIRRYYFFQPETNRLNRAYKKSLKKEVTNYNGHRIMADELNIYPQNHTLRHYMVLSRRHALEKYLNRRFDPIDLKKGWHKNRLNFTKDALNLPSMGCQNFFFLDVMSSNRFRRDRPCTLHFWEWKKTV